MSVNAEGVAVRLPPLRGLNGLSAGDHQALSIALAHPDTFAYIGVFIGALQDCERYEKEHKSSLEELGTVRKPKLLWVASGKKDWFYQSCQDTLRLFNRYNISYVYVEGKGLHNPETARNDLFVFAPLLFRDAD